MAVFGMANSGVVREAKCLATGGIVIAVDVDVWHVVVTGPAWSSC